MSAQDSFRPGSPGEKKFHPSLGEIHKPANKPTKTPINGCGWYFPLENIMYSSPKSLTQDCVASVPLRIDCCTKKTNYILEKEPILAFAFKIHASQKVKKNIARGTTDPGY